MVAACRRVGKLSASAAFPIPCSDQQCILDLLVDDQQVPIPSALRHRRSTLLQQAFGHRSLNLIAVQRTYRYSGFRIWYLMHLQWNLLGKLP